MKFNPLKRISIQQAIEEELYQARHELLKYQTHVEYARNMVTYNEERIKRLVGLQNEQAKTPYPIAVRSGISTGSSSNPAVENI